MANLCVGVSITERVLKMGSEGAMYASPQERMHVAGDRVATVDDTGAGDCFSGAFLTRFLAGNAPAEALRYANAAAALTTTGYGAVAPIPNRTSVEAFVDSLN